MRYAQGLASSKASGLIGGAVAALAGARVPEIKWRITKGPWFDDMIADLEFDGRTARLRFEQAVTDGDAPGLSPVLETDLS